MKKWLVIALLLYALPLLAQTYEWTDENGTVNFTEDLGKVPKKYRKKVKVIGAEESGAPQVTDIPEPARGKQSGERKSDKKEYAGKDEKGWRTEFANAKGDLAAARQDLADVRGRLADTSGMSRSEYLTLQKSLKHNEFRVLQLNKKMEELKSQADKEGVPAEWRE